MLLLLIDMFISIVRDSIAIADGGDSKTSSATAAIAIFGIVGLLFPLVYSVLVAIYLVYIYNGGTDWTIVTLKAISSFFAIVGAMLYLYGDNIMFVIKHAIVLDCDETCVHNNRMAAFICLGLALIIFHLAPPVFQKLYKFFADGDDAEEKNPWLLAMDMITVMVKTDMLYSVVFLMTVDIDFCSIGGHAASSVFIAICVLFAVIALIVYGIHALIVNDDGDNDSYLMPLTIFGAIVLIICLPLYLLADNEQPLGCTFAIGCGTQNTTDLTCTQQLIDALCLARDFPSDVSNQPFNCTLTCDDLQAATAMNITDLMCNQAQSGVRLGFTLLAFIVITVLFLLYTSRAFYKSEEVIAKVV